MCVCVCFSLSVRAVSNTLNIPMFLNLQILEYEWNHTNVHISVNIGYWKSRMIDYFSESDLIFILYSIFLSCV